MGMAGRLGIAWRPWAMTPIIFTDSTGCHLRAFLVCACRAKQQTLHPRGALAGSKWAPRSQVSSNPSLLFLSAKSKVRATGAGQPAMSQPCEWWLAPCGACFVTRASRVATTRGIGQRRRLRHARADTETTQKYNMQVYRDSLWRLQKSVKQTPRQVLLISP